MTGILDEYFAQRRNRGLGDILGVSGRTQQRAMAGAHAGARNLIGKALAALEDGDEDQAVRFATRAAHLPWDNHEEVWPGALAAHMSLFHELTEAMEGAAEGDVSWVDDAVTVLGELSGPAHRHFARTLGIFSWDAGIDSTPKEVKRIQRAVGTSREEDHFGDDPQETPEQFLPLLLEILRMTDRYHRVHFHGV